MIDVKSEMKIIVVSHLLAGPTRKNKQSGIFVKELLKAMSKTSKIKLIAPIDIIPSFNEIRVSTNSTAELFDHFRRTLFTKTREIYNPVYTHCIRYVSFPPKIYFDLLGAMQIAIRVIMKIGNNSEEYVLCHGHTLYPDGLASILIGKFLRIKKFVTVHGSDVHSVRKKSFIFRMNQFTMNQADGIITVSNDLKKQVQSNYNIDSDKIRVINNGVSPLFSSSSTRFNVRKNNNIPEKVILFLFVGNFVPVKDPLNMIEAFKKLSKNIKSAHLIMIGQGYLKPQLETMITNYELNNQIHLIGSVHHEELAQYMKQSDVLCISSVREGWPTIIFESFSCGLPIVSTSVGGISEAIVDFENGILVPAQNPEKLSQAMIKASSIKWDREKLIQYAMENSWENISRKYLKFYNDLMINKYYQKQ
jgi:teichuronic acid biosynthesis glycosyltransferase TuaC